MAVIKVEFIGEGREGGDKFDQTSETTRPMRVYTDSDLDGIGTVLNSPMVPSLGFPYITPTESLPLLRVSDRKARQTKDDPRIWIVDIDYSTDFSRGAGGGSGGGPGAGGAASPTNRPTNPLNEPVKWGMTFVKTTKAVLADKDGKDYVNSAGDAFSPPRERSKPLAQITAVKNYSSFTFSQALSYFEKVNLDQWHGIAVKSVKVDGLTIEEDFRNDQPFLRCTWVWLHDPDLWIPTKILDKGYRYKDGAGNPQLYTVNGAIIDGLLDGAGHKSVIPTYLLFRDYDTIAYSSDPLIP